MLYLKWIVCESFKLYVRSGGRNKRSTLAFGGPQEFEASRLRFVRGRSCLPREPYLQMHWFLLNIVHCARLSITVEYHRPKSDATSKYYFRKTVAEINSLAMTRNLTSGTVATLSPACI